MKLAVASCALFLCAAASAQSEASSRDAFLRAAEAVDLAGMKPLIAPPIKSMRGIDYSTDEFLEMIEGCRHSMTGKALISWKCDRGVAVTVSADYGPRQVALSHLTTIALSPGPPAAMPGATRKVAAAIESGDVAALTELTRGAIYSKLSEDARVGDIVRMPPSELVALARGCVSRDPVDPGPNAGPFGSGMVSFRCEGRIRAFNRCDDVGYGLFVRPMGEYFRLEVWPNEYRSIARCGPPRPPRSIGARSN